MDFPTDISYTETHEWVRMSGSGKAVVGLTAYAQEQLRDVVFIELPKVGKKFRAKDPCAVVESVKAAFDIYAPVSGEIVEVNTELEDRPELVNEDPYGKGWIFTMNTNNPNELKALLSAEAYKNLCEKEKH
ncbi:MAG TPA: glycine cleavage system protein GcvH [Candidatus Avalokitesvara rifleensis]|uniref:glycine cleavage system protein GcvH n=1 Tax=Candidatus Avalokitesvara rifleensis TaxID=3367620 RepID=UPI0027134E67|nr:glycine cleavage system protein GcvH [Candidatus Brocadiales bacterium]